MSTVFLSYSSEQTEAATRIELSLKEDGHNFHNGSATDLGAVVDFYNERFGAGIVGKDKEDLIAFLRAL